MVYRVEGLLIGHGIMFIISDIILLLSIRFFCPTFFKSDLFKKWDCLVTIFIGFIFLMGIVFISLGISKIIGVI